MTQSFRLILVWLFDCPTSFIWRRFFYAKIITKMFCSLKRFCIFAMSKRDVKNNQKQSTI